MLSFINQNCNLFYKTFKIIKKYIHIYIKDICLENMCILDKSNDSLLLNFSYSFNSDIYVYDNIVTVISNSRY